MIGFLGRLLLIMGSCPGIVIHELGHQIFCHLTGTRVLQVRYLRFGNPPGFVLHEWPRSTFRHALIGLGPLFVNTAFAFGLGWTAQKGLFPGESVWVNKVLPLWLAVAFGMHAFPSYGDAESLLDRVWSRGSGFFAKLFGTPVALLMFLGAFLSNLGLDLVFGLGLGLVLPWWLIRQGF